MPRPDPPSAPHGDPPPDWAALGLPTPRAVRVPPGGAARLAHLAELRDVTTPADAARATAEFAGEAHFAPDLLAARAWLPPGTPRRDVLAAVLAAEGAGFVALLGEYGPWVYAASVRDLQDLGRPYGALVAAARVAGEAAVYAAATRRPRSLLVRLEATDYRRPAPRPTAGTDLAELEAAFWHEAARQAGAARAARR